MKANIVAFYGYCKCNCLHGLSHVICSSNLRSVRKLDRLQKYGFVLSPCTQQLRATARRKACWQVTLSFLWKPCCFKNDNGILGRFLDNTGNYREFVETLRIGKVPKIIVNKRQVPVTYYTWKQRFWRSGMLRHPAQHWNWHTFTRPQLMCKQLGVRDSECESLGR